MPRRKVTVEENNDTENDVESKQVQGELEAKTHICSRKEINRTNLSRCDLSGADLSGVYLCEADMSGSKLVNANLTGAYMHRANLPGVNLHGAILPGANLHEANLNGADLSLSDLSWADLSGANLSFADLTGTNLNSANLSQVDLNGAKGILSISNLGTHEDILYIVLHENCTMVQAGKFWGTLENFSSMVDGKHASNEHHDIYRAAIKFIKIWENKNR